MYTAYATIKASDLTDTSDSMYTITYDQDQTRSALLYMPGKITDPNDLDSDDDGLSDYAEIHGYGTDPNNEDTDGDNRNDGDEIINSSPTNSTYEVIWGVLHGCKRNGMRMLEGGI